MPHFDVAILLYMCSLFDAYLGMAGFVYFFGVNDTSIVIYSLFFWIFIFSISGGFAGIAYLDIVGKVFDKEERGKLFTYKQLISSFSALIGGFIIKKIFDLQGLTFPDNYTLILIIAFSGLFTASLLFWLIKEPPSKVQGNRQHFKDFLKEIPAIIKKDKTFTSFIIVQNLTSISLMILPFYMVYAKETFNLDNSYIGKYLLFQISGAILSNFFWGMINRRFGIKSVIQLCILFGAAIPLLALIFGLFNPEIYSLIFFFVGFLISGRKIGFDPYLLDISPEENRTTYLGINGTFSLFIVVTPLLGGTFIQVFNFQLTFILVAIIMLFTGIFFSKKTE